MVRPSGLDDLTFEAHLSGLVNFEPIDVVGEGRIRRSEGLTDGHYQLRKVPRSFDPLLLASFLITGYPNASVALDDAINIFRDRSYAYQRALSLRDGGELRFAATCKFERGHITSRFHLSGSAAVPPLEHVEPLVESWEPYGPGGVRGHFTIAWQASDGRLVAGDAATTYQIESDVALTGMLHRFVSIDWERSGNRLRKVQHVGLFRRLPDKFWSSAPPSPAKA